jgi:hypothetical protein
LVRREARQLQRYFVNPPSSPYTVNGPRQLAKFH